MNWHFLITKKNSSNGLGRDMLVALRSNCSKLFNIFIVSGNSKTKIWFNFEQKFI